MPLLDNGRFDVVTGITPAKLAALLADAAKDIGQTVSGWVPTKKLPIPDELGKLLGVDFTLPISWDLQVGAGPLTLSQLPDGIRATWEPAVDSTWYWTELDLPALPWTDPPPGLPAGSAPFAGIHATYTADLIAVAQQVQLTDITATVTVDLPSVRAMPPVTYFLAWLDSQWPDWLTVAPGYFASLDDVAADFAAAVSAGMTTMLNNVLPDSLPAVTVPVGSVSLRLLGRDLLVLWEHKAGTGNALSVGRSPIRRDPAGRELDLVGVDVANAFLLGQVRTALSQLGWTATEGVFAPTHPCCWSGQHVILNKFDVSVAITGMLVALDDLNGITFSVTLSGAHAGGGFGVTGRARTYWSVHARDDGRTLGIVGEPLTVYDVDMWVAWWVYALMAVGGGPLGVLIAGLHDAIDGGIFSAELNALVGLILPKQASGDRVSFEIPWASALPRPAPRPQPDALPQIAPYPMPMVVSRECDVFLAVSAP